MGEHVLQLSLLPLGQIDEFLHPNKRGKERGEETDPIRWRFDGIQEEKRPWP